jgi:hypothetical protein
MLLQHPDALAVKFIDVRPSVTVLAPVAVEHVLRTDAASASPPPASIHSVLFPGHNGFEGSETVLYCTCGQFN